MRNNDDVSIHVKIGLKHLLDWKILYYLSLIEFG